MVSSMASVKSFLVTPYFLGVILGGVFLGIYVLIDKIIKNPIKDIDHYKKFVESYKEEADFYKMSSEEYKTMAITYRKRYLENQERLEVVMKDNSSHCKL